MSFVNENTANSSGKWHKETRNNRMVVRPITSPVRTINQFLPVQINENNASQIEEDTELLHEETINENKQNIVSRRKSIFTNYINTMTNKYGDTQQKQCQDTAPANMHLNMDERHS